MLEVFHSPSTSAHRRALGIGSLNVSPQMPEQEHPGESLGYFYPSCCTFAPLSWLALPDETL